MQVSKINTYKNDSNSARAAKPLPLHDPVLAVEINL
jgi:hypothetical protein